MYIYLDESSHLDSEKIIDETERHIDSIIARESRSFPLFLRRIPKPQLTVFRQKIREIVEVYPQKMRPFIMAWLIAAYFSIIP